MHSSLRTIDHMMIINDGMIGGGFTSYKNIFNIKHHFPKNESHTLEEIAKLTGYKKKGLQTIFNKGVGAYHTNPLSVRKQVKSPEQWAMGRVYASINPDSKAYQVDKSHLIKGGMIGGMAKVDKIDLSKTEIRKGNYYGYQPNNIDEEMEGNMFIRNAIENDTDDAYELRDALGLTDEEIIKKLNEEREALYKRYDTLGIEPLDQRIEGEESESEEEPESENEEEEEKSESESEEEEEKEEEEEIPIIPLVENSGYHFYNNLKKEYKINMANGLGWEKITVEVPSVQEPIKEYTNDNTPIEPQTDYYFNKMAPTEAIYKYWEKNKIAGRFPWDYIPCDLSNESTNIESKNYIKTQLHDPGRYIDNNRYLEIQEALKAGKTVEEIEKDLGKDIPYINITKSKLTSINKAGYSNVFRQKFKEENGKIYMDKVLYNGYYPNKEGTSVTKVYEKPIWEGKKGFIYDLLYDNARVIYDPLKDTNLKLIKDNRKNPKDSLPLYGSFDTSKYKTIVEGNEEFILVPITRCKIIPLK